MKRRSIIAAVLMLTLMTGCFTNYDEIGLTDISLEETSAEISDATEGSIDPSDMTMAPVDLDAWKMSFESGEGRQQIMIFENNGNRFRARLVPSALGGETNPSVVILSYSPIISNVYGSLKGSIEGITAKGMNCILIEAFGSGDSFGDFKDYTFENVNELLTVFLANTDKMPGVDSSRIVLWSLNSAGLFPLLAMKDKSDKFTAIVLTDPIFMDGEYLRKAYPDKEKLSNSELKDPYIEMMYDVDAKDFCKDIKTKVYILTAESDLPENVEMYKQYTEYFPDKAWIRAGTQEDYNEYLEKGKGAAFERLTEELTAIFGL